VSDHPKPPFASMLKLPLSKVRDVISILGATHPYLMPITSAFLL
jgi:hypothetical protein